MREGWDIKKLGELLEIQNGYAFNSKQFSDDGDMPLIRIRDLKIGTKTQTRYTGEYDDKYLVHSGDFLIGMDGEFLCHEWKGEVALLNQRVCRLQNFDMNLEPKFLHYGINKYLKDIEDVTAYATVKHISAQQIKDIQFPIPPHQEQKRIVAILDEAFAGIDTAIANTENNLANARELFDSYLNAVFTNQDDGWVNTSVENLVNEKILDKPLDGNHGEIHPKKADFVGSGIPFVMASDLVNGEVDQVHCNFITKEQGDSLRKGFACDGDVLLSHKGTIGRVAVLNTEHEYVMLTPQVTYYRIADSEVIHNRYLYYYFQSPKFQNEICEIAGAGSTRAYIGITKQLELPVSYPSKDVQIELATKFDALKLETQRLENIYKQKLTSLSELKQSLLQKAFSGELTAEGDKLMDEAVA